MRIQLTDAAESDLFNILDYIGQENPAAAVSVVEKIEAQLRVLEDHPLIGREGRVADTRELVLAPQPYVAVYEVSETAALVSRCCAFCMARNSGHSIRRVTSTV